MSDEKNKDKKPKINLGERTKQYRENVTVGAAQATGVMLAVGGLKLLKTLVDKFIGGKVEAE